LARAGFHDKVEMEQLPSFVAQLKEMDRLEGGSLSIEQRTTWYQFRKY